MVWAILAIIVTVISVVVWIAHLSSQAALTKSEKQTATDAEQQANKQAEMAQTVVNRPDKSELLDSLKKNTFIIVLFLLTGCSHTVKYVCPPLPKYSVEFANKAALQIQDIPDNTPVITILEDTMAFRKACGY